MSEHELIRAARAVLKDAREALRDAEKLADPDEIVMFTRAVRKAEAYLAEMIRLYG